MRLHRTKSLQAQREVVAELTPTPIFAQGVGVKDVGMLTKYVFDLNLDCFSKIGVGVIGVSATLEIRRIRSWAENSPQLAVR